LDRVANASMKYSLVLQSFGRESEYKRALFCLLSHESHANRQKLDCIILFTDNPQYFQQYLLDAPVKYVLLTSEKIKAMRGSIDFLHRMKIAMIEEAFQLTDADLLYVDSDTFFTDNPERILNQLSPGRAFMHVLEYKFDSLKDMPLPAGKPFRAFYNLITSRKFEIPSTGSFEVRPNMASWNAGIMAFHQTHKKFLPDIYALTNKFYPETKNHASEQYAFSIILQNKVELHPCNSVVYHYWYKIKKELMDGWLEAYMDTDWLQKPMEYKLKHVKKLTRTLPDYLEKHPLTIKDNSIQAFNRNEFINGLRNACRVIALTPRDTKFMRDVLYHTKRMFKEKFIN
jgi:hypothetical protein